MKVRTIRVFTAFSGYDSQMMALRKLEKDYPQVHFDLVGWCEIDKYAIMSHNAVFPEYADRHYNDISKVDWANVPDFDLFFYSSCCQDISSAGLQRGLKKGSGTRSSLIWHCLDAIKIRKPRYAILENVKALVSDKFYEDFISWQRSVDDLGYTSSWQVLNASDFDIPQNRERVFMVSIRNDIKQKFYFPNPVNKTKNVNDILEDNVDQYSYTAGDKVTRFVQCLCDIDDNNNAKHIRDVTNYNGHKISQMITCTRAGNNIPTILTTINGVESRNCLSGKGHLTKPAVIEIWETDTYLKCHSTMFYKSLVDSIPKDTKVNISNQRIIDAIKSLKPNQYIKLRRIMPSELLRFMGVSESDIDILISSNVKNVELVKQAGNSIVVDVLYHLFMALLFDVKSATRKTHDIT